MANCHRCKKSFGFREKKYVIAGLSYCYPCMTCTSCHSIANGSQRFIYATEVLCIPCNQARLIPLKEQMVSQILQLSLPNPLGTRVLLESGEVVKAYYVGVRIFGLNQTRFKSEGTFLITNRRIIYLQHRLSPIFAAQRNADYSFECSLPAISGAVLSQSAHNGLILYNGKSEVEIFLYGTPRFQFPVDVTLSALLKLRDERMTEIRKMSEREKVQVVMDFSWLRDYMDKGGVLLKTYKCPGCGAATEIPQEGKSAKCNFCNTSFYAEDVFKKIKDLIG